MFTGESMEAHKQVVDKLRSTFKSGVTIPEEFRRAQLTKLMALMNENEERFLEALHKDLAKVLGATARSSSGRGGLWEL